mmetsp:Transcript_33956/g.70108  ORF Transcript_33956/g.70108 Transcript_33956/m.70108 type:complete len:179 (-) Transcript_33956:459-995(-)
MLSPVALAESNLRDNWVKGQLEQQASSGANTFTIEKEKLKENKNREMYDVGDKSGEAKNISSRQTGHKFSVRCYNCTQALALTPRPPSLNDPLQSNAQSQLKMFCQIKQKMPPITKYARPLPHALAAERRSRWCAYATSGATALVTGPLYGGLHRKPFLNRCCTFRKCLHLPDRSGFL